MNDIRMCALERRAHTGTHRLCRAANVRWSLFVCVFYLLTKTISPDAGFDRHQEVPFILQSKLNSLCVFARVCVCTDMSGTDEVLNYKGYGAIGWYSSVWVLGFYGRSAQCHGFIHNLNAHSHWEIVATYALMIRLWELKSIHRLSQWPFTSVTEWLFSWWWISGGGGGGGGAGLAESDREGGIYLVRCIVQ